MQKQGKFLLFNTAGEFSGWLGTTVVSRHVVLIQNHHTWLPNYATFRGNNHFGLLQGMESSHLERGFAEIAQNLTTFPDGSIAVCRSFDKIPAGIKGANTGGICIENLGNFDVGGDQMTVPQRDTIIELNARLCHKFSLEPDTNTIVYHHWYDLTTGVRTNGSGSTKTCPGTNFFGGNKVENATANFVPPILSALRSFVPSSGARPVALGSYAVNASTLNVRVAPNGSARFEKQLSQGVRVNVYRIDGAWMLIHPTEQQWANGRYLTLVP